MSKHSQARKGAALTLALVFVAATQVFPRQEQTLPSSGEAEEAETAKADASTARWLVYQNKTHDFSIKYPRDFVILRERADDAHAPRRPKLLARVRFQDRKVLSYETAELEPPQLSVEVFENKDSLGLRDWLNEVDWAAPGDTVEPLRLEGAREAVRVTSPRLMAPNEFYIYRAGPRVFRLTPLGRRGAVMVSTFRLAPRAEQ